MARSVGDMRGDIPEVSAELISEVRKDILAAAFQGLGHPYVWGGTSFEYGWDCSGFVQWAYAQAGVALPRTEQWLPMVQTNNPSPATLWCKTLTDPITGRTLAFTLVAAR
ncbi:NlpC/P60 family protein [Arthrobacter alpinus]|nr:NlpC/P60 family protein [Arthrobacter alpinus]